MVFGKASGFAANLNLSSLNGSNGFKLSGVAAYDYSGCSVSAAGDVNGDGFGDLIIGAKDANPNGYRSGASYVVFGSALGPFATVSIGDATVVEPASGTAMASFTVTLSSPSAQTVTVQYATADGTATASRDYIAANLSTLTFAPGETSKFVLIPVNADSLAEGNETFLLDLRNATNATIADAQGLGTILDDDFTLKGRSVTLTDLDGDVVTIKTSKGVLRAENFLLAPDGSIAAIDMRGEASFARADFSITAEAFAGGNGTVDVGMVNAANLNLGKVTVSGTLGRIMAGDGDGKNLP